MYCALTGEAAVEPVVTLGGILYDREAIEKHIKQHGTCPILCTPLHMEDLIPLKIADPDAAPPRQLGGESIPGVLNHFQTEYDALMFESLSIKKQLEEVRKELARTLYQNDAACRVVARLMRERDHTLNEIEQLQKAIGKTGPKPEAIEIVLAGLDADSRNKITQKYQELSSQRKQRVVSTTLATVETIHTYRQVGSFPPHQAARPGILSLDIHPVHQELTVTGGVDTTAVIFDLSSGKKLATLAGHKKQVNCALFHPSDEIVITASADSQVWIWAATTRARTSYKIMHQITQHTDEVVQISLHALSEYLATASRDGTWAFHNIIRGQTLLQVSASQKTPLTSVMLHPDGAILATGIENNEIKIWDIRSQKNVATFDSNTDGHTDAITDLCFSENGIYLASAARDNILKLWDLRRPKNIKTLKMDASVQKLNYDYSGNYLAVATGAEIRIFAGNQLEHAHTLHEHTGIVTDVKFGKDALFLASTSMDRTLKLWGK